MTLSDVKAVVDILKEQPAVHNAFGDGLVISNDNMVCFFCCDMIKIACSEMLVPLVEEYGKVMAQRMLGQDKQPLDLAPENDLLLPLQDVVNCVGDKYPELLDLQHQYEHAHGIDSDDGKTLLWNTESNNDGPLVEFCRLGLYSDNLQCMCIRSVKAEVDRLNNIRHGVSVSSRVEGAATIQNVGESFETSFRLLCQMLQLFNKSLDTLCSRNQHINDTVDVNNLVNEMKVELLKGCGGCLTRLVTEYCFFKNEIEDNDLYFDRLQEKGDDDGSDSRYLQNVNMATLEFPLFLLRCRPDQNGKPQNPIDYLRSIFPGSAGSNLSQMWSLCTYDGESKKDDHQHAEKKLELFINHLESTCLTLCGIPFTVLDKKSEKKMLAERRESILDRIEQSLVEEEVVLCSTVLVYQNVKSISISGRQTIISVLKVLEHDKKIPREVTKALKDLLANAGGGDPDLLMQAKGFAGAKNSKALSALVNHG